MIKKSILSLFSILLLVAVFVPTSVNAQEGWWSPSYEQFKDKVKPQAKGGPPDTEIFGERYTLAQVNWIINSLTYIFTGRIAACATDLNPTALTACLETASGSGGPILALAAASDSLLVTKPASGVEYIAQKMNDLNLVKTANAQGYGYTSALAPIQKLWLVSRNAAYLISTLAMVVLAFLIMIRSRISAQATITVQSALPRVAIALLFITFSYAIAGLLVDLTFVAQGILGAIVSSSGLSDKPVVEMFNAMNDGIRSLLSYGVSFILQSMAGGGIFAQLSNSGIFGTMFSGLDTVIALFIFLLLLWALVKIFWLLLRTYAVAIFLVIAAPFIGIQYVVSPSSNAIVDWIRKFAAQMAVFFAIGAGILFVHILFFSTGNGTDEWSGLIGGLMGANPFGILPQANSTGPAGLFPSGFSFTSTSSIGFFTSLVLALSLPKFASSARDQIATGRGSYAPGGFKDMAGPFAGAALGTWAFGKKAVSQPVTKFGGELVTPLIERGAEGIKAGFTKFTGGSGSSNTSSRKR